MESLKCNTKKIANEISSVSRGIFHSIRDSSNDNLRHRALLYAPQNREDSRSSDFESQCRFFSSILDSFANKKAREASRSAAQISEWKLVSDSDWWKRTFYTHYPTSVPRMNRKLDSFVKCLPALHPFSTEALLPHLRLDQLRYSLRLQNGACFMQTFPPLVSFETQSFSFFFSVPAGGTRELISRVGCLNGSARSKKTFPFLLARPMEELIRSSRNSMDLNCRGCW